MDDLFTVAPRKDNVPTLSVTELSGAIKRTLETGFSRVRVRGELSRVVTHRSGHIYTDLKDADSVINVVAWRGTKLSITPEEGMDVIITGRVTSYAPTSRYQLVVESMELAGAGALLKLLADRKAKLAAEGLFDAARKRALPFLPEVIGVITSPTGAVIRDIIHRVADRCGVRILVWPVAVQGVGAAEQVAAAINSFNALETTSHLRPDILIVARGGGALEDLMPFNEEIVVRAAASSTIPLISAVGHETDTTLIDHAADWRAPTPTAAAEKATPVKYELINKLLEIEQRVLRAVTSRFAQLRLKLDRFQTALQHPERQLEYARQKFDELESRLHIAPVRWKSHQDQAFYTLGLRLQPPVQRLDFTRVRFDELVTRLTVVPVRWQAELNQKFCGLANRLAPSETVLNNARLRLQHADNRLLPAFDRRRDKTQQNLARLDSLLESYSHKKILSRGFALVTDETGQLIKSASQAKQYKNLQLTFADGETAVRSNLK